jgi:hypothetical protein
MILSAPYVLLTVLGLCQRRGVDLTRPPWAGVMETIQASGDADARTALEHIGAAGPGAPWERAHAFRWAGQIAMRHGDLERAEEDFARARAADPGGFDARMSQVHLGEIAIREHRWYRAERELSAVERDPDPLVATYAGDRLSAVRQRTRRLTLRYASLTLLALAGLLLALATARFGRRAGLATAFARALLVTEGVAIAGALVVPRAGSLLAQPGWMASAIPGAVLSAFVWAALLRGAPWRRRLVVLIVLGAALAAGLYLALDWTWWSVERPLL